MNTRKKFPLPPKNNTVKEDGIRKSLSGRCERCDNYSQNLKEVQGRLLCIECRQNIGIRGKGIR